MKKTTHDDLEDTVDYYNELCDWVREHNAAHPLSLFTALSGALWYIATDLGFDADKTLENFGLLLSKWQHRQRKRKQKEQNEN